MAKTKPFRLPYKDYAEIRAIANRLEINLQSAYSLWKRKKFNTGKWQDLY